VTASLRIYEWAADQAGCGYYRMGLPASALKGLGHETYCSMILEPFSETADVIIGQRVCKEGPSALWQKMAKEDRVLIYEVDDDLLHVDPSSVHAYPYFKDPGVHQRIKENAAVASMVTVTTEHLATVMREFNDNVVVIPNFIDESVLEIMEPKDPHTTIGWAGSTTHAMDFAQAGRMLKKVASRLPDVHFHFAGADYGYNLFPKDRYKFTDFFPIIEDHYHNVATIDIGIAPLAPHVFNQSKSSVKALEYAALGIPVVASHSEPYRDFVKHGETGFLVRTDYEWVDYITRLVKDHALRADMAAASKALAAENTIQKNAYRWEDAIRSLL
jgi:glycosyltransferase involved in cell wall biosynthesis